MRELADKRRRMVETQIERRGIEDERVLDAMRTVPRDEFVDEALVEHAYQDAPLPVGAGQTISQPYIVALMTETLLVGPEDDVLEIGTGSGYAAAVLSRVARTVYTVERHGKLAERARRDFERLGYDNIHVRHGDGTLGWYDHAPYDGIVVTAGGPDVPAALRQQLAVGGRIVIPVGATPQTQTLVRVTRVAEEEYAEEDLGAVRFVPLIGEQGWDEPG